MFVFNQTRSLAALQKYLGTENLLNFRTIGIWGAVYASALVMIETCPSSQRELKGIVSSSRYASGALKACMLNQANHLDTAVGTIIPQYRPAQFGERQKKHRSSIDFFESGAIKSAALDEQLPLQTSLGIIGAELVTFYENGSINRIFPLNGLIDGYWSEKNEFDRADDMSFDLPIGRFSVKVISIHFYPNGDIKSVTFWPGQTAMIKTPVGIMECRAGFSLYEGGAVRSVEPKQAVELSTPIGSVRAFDPDIIGMHADSNSIHFNTDGSLRAFKTIHTGVRVTQADQNETVVEPFEMASFVDPSQLCTVPIAVEFNGDEVQISGQSPFVFSLKACIFETFLRERTFRATCGDCPGDETCCQNGGDGDGCGGCGGC